MRYALIQNNLVNNVCEWDGSNKWQPPVGCIAVQTDTGDIGDTYDGINFTTPAPLPPDPNIARTQQAVAVLKNTFKTNRTVAQINNSLDALTFLVRQAYIELRDLQI